MDIDTHDRNYNLTVKTSKQHSWNHFRYDDIYKKNDNKRTQSNHRVEKWDEPSEKESNSQ